jgi:hypothetical protein
MSIPVSVKKKFYDVGTECQKYGAIYHGAYVIKLFTAIVNHHSMVILSFCGIKAYYFVNNCGTAVYYYGKKVL